MKKTFTIKIKYEKSDEGQMIEWSDSKISELPEYVKRCLAEQLLNSMDKIYFHLN